MRWRLWFLTGDLRAEAGDVVFDRRVPEAKVKLQMFLKLLMAVIVHSVTCLSAGVAMVSLVTRKTPCGVTRLEVGPAEILTKVLIAWGVHLVRERKTRVH